MSRALLPFDFCLLTFLSMPTNQLTNPYYPFIQSMLKAADLDMLPEEEYDQYIDDVTREIERRVGLLILQELPEDDFTAYTTLVTSGNDEELRKAPEFLEEKIENWQDKLGNVLKTFGEEFIKTAQNLKV